MGWFVSVSKLMGMRKAYAAIVLAVICIVALFAIAAVIYGIVMVAKKMGLGSVGASSGAGGGAGNAAGAGQA